MCSLKDKKIVLFNDTSQESHPGCRVAGGQIVEWLQKHTSPNSMRRFDVQFSWKFRPCPQDYEEFQALVESQSKSISEVRDAIDWSDTVVVNGEGTLLGFRPPVRNILLFLEIAHRLKKQTALLNSTIDTWADPDALTLMARILPFVNLICVREIESYALLRKMGCSKTVTTTDASFAWLAKSQLNKSAPILQLRQIRKSIAVFGSVQLGWHNYKYLRAFLLALSKATAYSLTFIPMTGLEFNIFHKLNSELAEVLVDGRNYDGHSIVNLLRSHRMTVTGRYHGAIFSIASRTPFIHYETHSGRIKWLSKQIGIEKNFVPILRTHKEITRSKVMQRLLDVVARQVEIIESELPFQVQMAELQEKYLDSLLRGNLEQPIPAEEQKIRDARLVTFANRARAAASMPKPKLRVLDCGGFLQEFSRHYASSSYTSVDMLYGSSAHISGQPSYDIEAAGAHLLHDHIEADLNNVTDFRRFGKFDIAVCLGLLTWLDSWRSFLTNLAYSEIQQILVSWDEIGIARVTKLLSELNYDRIQIKSGSDHTVIALFKRI